MSKESKTIIIKKNTYGEFEVPTGVREDGTLSIYYASDRDDARDTLVWYHGKDCEFKFARGSYNEDG
jgi:hypothetical protein